MERIFPIIVRNTGYLEIEGNMVFVPIPLTETVTTTRIECKISTYTTFRDSERFNLEPNYEFDLEVGSHSLRFKILDRIDIY